MLEIGRNCLIERTREGLVIYTPEKKVYFNNHQQGKEVLSLYPTEDLVERILNFNSPDSLVSFDISGGVRRSPEMIIVINNLINPTKWHRWINHPEWAYDFFTVLGQAVRERWSKEEMETFSIKYAQENALPHYSKEFLRKMAEESPPLFAGVIDFVNSLPEAKKVIVTRGFEAIMEKTCEEMRIEEGYYEVEDKGQTQLEHAQKVGAKRIWTFGDLEPDIRGHQRLTQEGYETEMTLVCKFIGQTELQKDATIWIPRNYQGLVDLVNFYK